MADKSKIEWTEATVNVVIGCTKARPQGGCKHCYAARIFPRAYPGELFTNVRYMPERLDQLRRWKKGRLVFLNSMGDIFHESMLAQNIHHILDVVQETPQHIYQILTKRPLRAKKILKARGEPLKNVWMGISVEDQQSANDNVQYVLEFANVAVRFLSIEPLIGPIDLEQAMFGSATRLKMSHILSLGYGLDWVIVGGESGKDKRPMDEEWVRSIRDVCAAHDVKFFYKQRFDGGTKISCPLLDGKLHIEYPDHLHEYRHSGQRKLI